MPMSIEESGSSRRRFLASVSGAAAALVAPFIADATSRKESWATPRLLDPVSMGDLKLSNRMVIAPLTRGRAGPQRMANALMAEYYAQHASAGLIVSEATAISPQGYGWIGSPGIYTDSHVAGWAGVTDAVHRRQGRIFLQLWHMGRASHPDFLDAAWPIGPSAIAAFGETQTPFGKKPYVVPREMTQQEISVTAQTTGPMPMAAMCGTGCDFYWKSPRPCDRSGQRVASASNSLH
jgi:hypothetical protein